MAFNQFQIDELNKIEGFGKAYEKGSKQAAKVAGDVALLMIPGLGTIKLARAGGKLTQSAMEFVKRARKMYPKSKINGNPTAKQIAEAKPMGNVKLKTPTQVAANVQKSRPRATPQGGKPTTIKDKPRAKPDTKTVEKAPPKPAAPGLKKNRQRVDNKKDTPSKVKSTKQMRDAVKARDNAKTAAERAKAQRTINMLLGTLGVGAVGAVTQKALSPTKPRAEKRKTTPDTKKISPKGRPGSTTPNTKKISPKGKPGATTPNTKKMPPKGRPKNAKDPIQGKAPTNGNKVKPSSKPAAKPSPKTTAKKTPKPTSRKETRPERRSDLPAGVLRKFQGTLRKDEVIRNIGGVSYVIKRKDSAFAGKKR